MSDVISELILQTRQKHPVTSIVVTHDMRLGQKLADRLVFLHEAKAIFFGTTEEMEQSDDPLIRQFLALDDLVLPGR